jgi:hypothetical protein
MAFNHHKDLKYILHPYIFVLKENKDIRKDLFDYSLMMMKVGTTETLRSPYKTSKLNVFINHIDLL